MNRGPERRPGQRSSNAAAGRGSSGHDVNQATGHPLTAEMEEAIGLISEPTFNPLYPLLQIFEYPSGDYKLEGSDRTETWQRVVHRITQVYASSDMTKLLSAVRERRSHRILTLKSQGTAVDARIGIAEQRLVVGLGSFTPLETGLAFHHVYGIPYIPGSSIKGLVRAWVLDCAADNLGVYRLSKPEFERRRSQRESTPFEKLERYMIATDDHSANRALAELKSDDWVAAEAPVRNDESGKLREDSERDLFREVFGSMNGRGHVTFLDAFPTSLAVKGAELLELDVMNPHYRDYYDEAKAPPADYMDPVPVGFMTVRQGASFQFDAFGRDSGQVEWVLCRLKEALEEWGIGAKTNAGYGRMDLNKLGAEE